MTTGSTKANKAWSGPCRGSITLCRFPYDENSTIPGPKVRPAIVLDVEKVGNRVMVCYGTGQAHHVKLSDLRPDQVGVLDGHHVRALGLEEATVFDLNRTVFLPYDTAWFKAAPSRSSPIIGNVKSCGPVRQQLLAAMTYSGLGHLLPTASSAIAGA